MSDRGENMQPDRQLPAEDSGQNVAADDAANEGKSAEAACDAAAVVIAGGGAPAGGSQPWDNEDTVWAAGGLLKNAIQFTGSIEQVQKSQGIDLGKLFGVAGGGQPAAIQGEAPAPSGSGGAAALSGSGGRSSKRARSSEALIVGGQTSIAVRETPKGEVPTTSMRVRVRVDYEVRVPGFEEGGNWGFDVDAFSHELHIKKSDRGGEYLTFNARKAGEYTVRFKFKERPFHAFWSKGVIIFKATQD